MRGVLQTNLNVLVYMGTPRKKHQTPESLAPYDIVLTSPTIVRVDSEMKSERSIFRWVSCSPACA